MTSQTGVIHTSVTPTGAAAGAGAGAWAAAPADWSRPHVPGRLLVTSVSGGPSLSTLGVQGEAVTPGVTLLSVPTGQEAALAARLQARGARTQPDYLYAPLATPNDPGLPGNGGVPLGGSRYVQSYLTRVQAPQAWTFLLGCGKTPAAALTAVMDSQVNPQHADLQGRLAPARSYLSASDGGPDTGGHGTATTGLIAATTNNGAGLAGVTWSGQAIPMEVIGSLGASTSTLTRALDEAVTLGVKVVNMSLGGPVSGTDDPDPALSRALSRAAQSVVLVAAAGNTPGDGLYYPASHPQVLAVGAAGADDTLACYSARPAAGQTDGQARFLIAPGGTGTCAGATNATQLLTLDQSGGYTLQAGTSFAAPLVAGAAALMRAANPQLSAADTRARLLESARVTAAGQRMLDVNAAVRAATR